MLTVNFISQPKLVCSHIRVTDDPSLRLHISLPVSVASPAMGHWGTCLPPRLPTISLLVHFGVNLTANYPTIV